MQLTVERTSYGPDMISHNDDGKTVFVSGAVPGDVVDAKVVKREKAFDRAIATAIVSPSPLRVKSPCPYSSVCGGCPWAELKRDEQLCAKRACVVDALARTAHIPRDRAEELVKPCLAPSDPWGYRNKVELDYAVVGNRPVLGMHAKGSTSVVKVDRCLLFDKRFNRLPKAVSGSLSYLSSRNKNLTYERVGIRASTRTNNVEVALWTNPGPYPREQAAKILQEASKATSVVRVLQKGPAKARRVTGVERLSGAGSWSELIAGGVMRLSAPSFFQVNTKGADKLVELVLDALNIQPDEEAMDLYCGAGTFTLPLARKAAWVSAVESYGPAVRDLRRNLESAGLDNVEAIGGDAGREFPDDADVIVVDPPRAGLGRQVVELLSQTRARAIAYVSCDPATLARDLATFAQIGSFSPKSLQPVDLFPQTFHVETVCLLTRN